MSENSRPVGAPVEPSVRPEVREAFERIALPNFHAPARGLIEDHWRTWQEAWEAAQSAERERRAALVREARRQFDHWVLQRQHAEESALRLKVLDALAAISGPNAEVTGLGRNRSADD